MKKFFQNIKFKNISLTTLALALVVSGFLVWGNTEAAITGIAVTSPNGEEVWSRSHNITWTTEPSGDGGTVNIYLVEGESSSPIATEVANNGSYSWDTTAHTDGSSYKIKISSSADPSVVYSESANVFTIDNTAPTISIGEPSLSLTKGGPVTYTITYGGASGITLGGDDLALNTTGDATGTMAVSGEGTTERTVTISDITGTGTLGISIGTGTARDVATPVNLAGASGPSTTFTVDNTLPTASTVTMASDNTNTALAKIGDVVTLTIITDEDVAEPTVTIGGLSATTVAGGDAQHWTATITMTEGETEGALAFTLDFTDLAGNAGTQVTSLTGGSAVTFDKTAPTVTATISPNTGTAKVGDTITAILTAGGSQADLNLSGTCTINDVDVTGSFVNNTGGTYTLSYVIGGGNTDRAEGALPVSCTLAETSGNTVTLSSFEENTLVVDANSPAAPSITSIAGNGKINDLEKAAVIIVGTAEANATISGSLTGTGTDVTVSGTADGSGNFSITVDASGLSDGTLSLSITATDAAGNESDTGAGSVVKDIRERRSSGGRGSRTTTTTVTTPVITPTAPVAPTTPTPYYFTTTMRLGSYAGEVLPLQQFLAGKGYFTDTLNGYFGQTTFLAVKAYQKANGLGDDGIVGPMTRAVLNANPTTPTTPTTPTAPTTQTYTYNFGTRLLVNGSRGDDVKEIQRFLNKALGLKLVEDGVLGPKTISIIKQWQKSQGLKDDGIVGPQTKTKMLELAKGFK